MNKWRPFRTAPKDGVYVLVWNGFRRAIARYAEYRDGSGGWHRQNLLGEPLGRADSDPETHWTPIPNPPIASRGRTSGGKGT